MSNETALTVTPPSDVVDVVPESQIELLQHTYGAGLKPAEFDLFVHAARRLGLDPFAGQVTPVKRGGRMSIQVTIDGFRAKAEQSGRYEGQAAPLWCGEDGEWKDVWLGKKPPEAAKVAVFREGFREPIVAIAAWGAYNQGNGWWAKQGGGAHMLAKCAEALALRKAFPNVLSGCYTGDEMGQAGETRPPRAQEAQWEEAPEPPQQVARQPEHPAVRKVTEALGGEAHEPRKTEGRPQSEAGWLLGCELAIKAKGWTLGDAAEFLSVKFGKDGTWAQWSKAEKQVKWLATNVGYLERPKQEHPDPHADIDSYGSDPALGYE